MKYPAFVNGEVVDLPVVVVAPGDTDADIADKYPQQTRLVRGKLRYIADCLVTQGEGPIKCSRSKSATGY